MVIKEGVEDIMLDKTVVGSAVVEVIMVAELSVDCALDSGVVDSEAVEESRVRDDDVVVTEEEVRDIWLYEIVLESTVVEVATVAEFRVDCTLDSAVVDSEAIEVEES